MQYQPWHFYINHEWTILPVLSTRLLGHQPIIQLEGCHTPEDARRYTGIKISVLRDQLPPLPKGEYYWSQLIGLTVISTGHVVLGVVDHLFETGANDVLVVMGEKERLIPYLPGHVIQNIDLDASQIIVDWDPEF